MNTTPYPIEIVKQHGTIEAAIPSNDQERVCWRPDKSSYYLKFKVKDDPRWYYQWLVWSCRGGKRSYFRQVVALYRELRKQGIVAPKTLHALAG